MVGSVRLQSQPADTRTRTKIAPRRARCQYLCTRRPHTHRQTDTRLIVGTFTLQRLLIVAGRAAGVERWAAIWPVVKRAVAAEIRSQCAVANDPTDIWRVPAETNAEHLPLLHPTPTIGGRAFPVAGAKVWNGRPSDVTSASSLPVFKNRLKTYLFRRCYETVWLWITFPFPRHYLPSRTVVLAIVFTV